MKKSKKKKISRFSISMEANYENRLKLLCKQEGINKSAMVRKMIAIYEKVLDYRPHS